MPGAPDRVLRILAEVPELATVEPGQISTLELHGTTNRNFRITTPRARFALRIAVDDKAGFVDRAWELQSARLAAAAGIGPAIIHADPSRGIVLSAWIEGVPLTGEMLRGSTDVLRRAARLLARLHRSGLAFPRCFDALAILQTYQEAARARGLHDAPWSGRVAAALDRTRDLLRRNLGPQVPSHCDPVPGNFLDDGDRMTLVDWEYAGSNDPAWDLGYLALESGLSGERLEALLHAYGGGVRPDRVRSYQLVAACMGAVWSRLKDPAGGDLVLAAWASERLVVAEEIAANS